MGKKIPIYAEVRRNAWQPPLADAPQSVAASIARWLFADNECLPNIADIDPCFFVLLREKFLADEGSGRAEAEIAAVRQQGNAMELIRVWVLGKLPRGNLSHPQSGGYEAQPWNRKAGLLRTSVPGVWPAFAAEVRHMLTNCRMKLKRKMGAYRGAGSPSSHRRGERSE